MTNVSKKRQITDCSEGLKESTITSNFIGSFFQSCDLYKAHYKYFLTFT